MKTLPETILAHAHGAPEGQVLSPKQFLHLGSRMAIDQALSRLARAGHLIRIGRGTYVAPVREMGDCRPPLTAKVVESLAALSGELIVPDGATSAILLGLTKRRVVSSVYLTSGRSRRLALGGLEVTLRHAPAWMLTLGKGAAGAAVRAMAWLGPHVVDKAIGEIRSSLSSSEWLVLVSCRAALPSWMARAIGKYAASSSQEQLLGCRSRPEVHGESDLTMAEVEVISAIGYPFN